MDYLINLVMLLTIGFGAFPTTAVLNSALTGRIMVTCHNAVVIFILNI